VSVGSHSGSATGFPGYWSRVPRSAATIARVLQTNGYATYALGKWDHLPNEDVSPAGPFTYWPSGQGFDHFYGFVAADSDHFHPLLWQDQNPVDPWRGRSDYYLTTDLADHAIQWITTQQAIAPRPFFMYFATGAVHSPHHVPRDVIDKYRGRFDQGWDQAREQILANQKRLHIVPADAQLPARPTDLPAWTDLSAQDKKMAARQMETFAAELDMADHEFGRILDTLKKLGEYDNTIIVVLSDNGASAEGGPEGTFNETYFFNGKLANFALNEKYFDAWGGPGTYPHYSAAWAMAGNTPFKYFKQTVHEGGTHDPLIVSWPKGIRNGGGIRNQFHHVDDVMPTLLDAIGIAPPAQVDGVAQQRIDGISMRYAFDHPDAPTRKTAQYFEMYGNRGVWADGWKAVVAHNPRPWKMFELHPVDDDVWELYHIDADFNELHDLAASNPKKLEELQKLFDTEARRNQVYPILPDFLSKKKTDAVELLHSHHGEFDYAGNERRIPEVLSPPVLNHSFTITAKLSSTDAQPHGVIVAQGGEMGGYALYLDQGRPVFCYNYFGNEHYIVKSTEPLPRGASVIRFEFKKTGEHQGRGTLFIGDAKVAEGAIEHTEPAFHSINETFDLGRDDGTPVSADYAGKDVLTAQLSSVVFHVDED